MIDLFGSIIMVKDCYESDIESIDMLECDVAFLAKGAAFLPF